MTALNDLQRSKLRTVCFDRLSMTALGQAQHDSASISVLRQALRQVQRDRVKICSKITLSTNRIKMCFVCHEPWSQTFLAPWQWTTYKCC